MRFPTAPLRRVVLSVDNGAWGDEPAVEGQGARCIRAADFDYEHFRVEKRRAPVRLIAPPLLERLRLAPGDLIVEKSGGGEDVPVGRVVLFDHQFEAVTSNFAARVRLNHRVESRFITYVLASQYAAGATFRCIKQTTGIQNLDTNEWLNSAIPVPDLVGQRRIADFLDEQVFRIDSIITARREQVGRVSARLDSERDAAFDEDHVADWAQIPLRATCAYFTDGDWIESPYITGEGIRLIQTGNVGVGEYREQGFKYISESTFIELKCKDVLPGDVLISRLAAPVARACRAPDLGRAVTSVDVVIARPRAGIDSDYLVQFLSSPRHLSDSNERARGSTLQRVSRSQLGAIRIPVPSYRAQVELAGMLAQVAEETRLITDSLTRSIALLTEYKQSLITEAVTGELDVTTASTRIPA